MPSAIPRNRENDPSVTIRGGRWSREIRRAFRPPPARPVSRATDAAAGSESFQSLQAMPKTTAARPIIDPTDRSMPPVMMMGVSATASSPSSTLNRKISITFAVVKNLSAIAEKTVTSLRRAIASTHNEDGTRRSMESLSVACDGWFILVQMLMIRPAGPALCAGTQCVHDNSGQDDSALDRPFPIGAGANESKCRPDSAEQNHTENRSNDTSCSACYGRTADNNAGNDFHFQPQSRVARNLVKAHRVEYGSKTGEHAGKNK